MAGLSDEKIRLLAAGERPNDLTDAEAIAHDMTKVLLRGRTVPNSLYNAAITTLGLRGTTEIAYLISCYQLISNLPNLFDVTTPADPA